MNADRNADLIWEAGELEAAIADLRAQAVVAADQVDDLKAFEQEYRTRLLAYLQGQVAELDPDGDCSVRAAMIRVAAAPDGELAEAAAELSEAQRSRLLAALLRIPVAGVTA